MMNKKLKTLELTDLRKRYTVKTETNNTGWSKTNVKVFDNEHSTTEPIYEYHRNYSMLNTFEPFRLWDDLQEKWRNFALIAPQYTNFQVLDLDNKEIIAKNPPFLVDEDMAKRLNKSYLEKGEDPKYTVGQDVSGWRFCPGEFHVPDVYDILDENDIQDMIKNRETEYWNEWIDNFLNKRTFGFEAGCVWGDDWSYKVQAIDLTKILQGEVSDDDRFGYFVLHGKLKDLYDKAYYDEEYVQHLVFNAPISFTFDKDDPKKVVKSKFYGEKPPHFEG